MQALLQTLGIPYTGSGVLGSALAMFSLKYASLLQFDTRFREDETVRDNLHTLYGVQDALEVVRASMADYESEFGS